MLKIVPLALDTPFSEGFVHAFAVLGETATLIDTGNPGEKSFNQLKSQLKNHGLSINDFDSIVLTHMHTDHSGGVSLLQQEADLPVIVHELAKPMITGGMDEFERINDFFNTFLVECGADLVMHQHTRKYEEDNWYNVHYVKDGDILQVGGEPFHIVHVPGHSQTDILLWNEQSGIAILGDHLIAELSVNAFIEPPSPGIKHRPTPLIQYRNSLECTRKLPLSTCYSGHGNPFTQHAELISKRLNEHENRCRQIHSLLEGGSKNVLELCQGIYPRLKGKTVFLGLSQIQGHLDIMGMKKEVGKELLNGVFYYHLL